MTIPRLALAALAATMLVAPPAAQAAPKAQLIARWQQSGTGLAVDYAGWGAFLDRYGSRLAGGRTVLAYGRVSAADKAALSATVSHLAAIDVDRLTRVQQHAYWINLYNALTIQVVLGAYPVSSILNIKDGLFPTGPWDRKVVTVKGMTLSLNDIEHGILRPIFRDPRTHFAINCASVGCPNLALTPYEASRLDAQLDAAARGYVNDPRGFRLKGTRLIASQIFDWYGVDFGGPKGVLGFARRFADAGTARMLGNRATIDGYDYDWSLNEAR
ncbi:DUF547 domain-containing protein [Sphingomonas sp. 28-63-12]|uniref:DUF547 domain-containing protein n=1 Tax=Sphingomonas sp. 28-63-12 TaxID=1970434 RepID=UPI000BD60A35|nr:MAG: hypothetical protein B7Y47_05975 [Sphingomonas sp. 28-63-12]